MGTKATIGIKFGESRFDDKKIYCHFDGYPSNVGVLLLRFYNSKRRAKHLVSLGGIVGLWSQIRPTKRNKDSRIITYAEHGEKVRHTTDWEKYNYIFYRGHWYMGIENSTILRRMKLIKKKGVYSVVYSNNLIETIYY